MMRAGLALLLLAALSAQAANWVRLRTPYLELYTDAGEKAGRATLDRFDQLRSVFPQPEKGGQPTLRLFLFNSEREFRGYTEDASTAGFYESGTERDYVVLRAGAGVTRSVAHEYIHLVLNHGPALLPLWFEEGTAELYSNLTVDRGGMSVGAPIREHVSMLGSQRWLAAGELAGVTRTSALYKSHSLQNVFYAESWALVHMLNLAPQWRDGMPRFAELLESGRDDADAFREAFGRTLDQALTDLRLYPAQLRGTTVRGAAPLSRESTTVEALTPLSSALARVDLALHVRRPVLARALIEQATKSQPDSPQAEFAQGMLALAEDRRDQARAHFEKAIAAGTQDADTYFELAMLERDSNKPVSQLLQKAIELNPDFAEAYFILGAEASDKGDYAAAVAHLQEAVRARPRDSSFWNALAYAQAKLGQNGNARQSALRAIRASTTPEQERMGQALLGSLP